VAADAERLHEHGEALAVVDDRLNRALRATDGDELAAYDLLLDEEQAAHGGSVQPGRSPGAR
jgi:hypothetical protein